MGRNVRGWSVGANLLLNSGRNDDDILHQDEMKFQSRNLSPGLKLKLDRDGHVLKKETPQFLYIDHV